MVERPARLNRVPEPAPFAAMERREEVELANEIERITAAIKDFADEEIRCAIFMKPGNGVGAWTWCDDATLPIDLPAIMAEMKERFGAGNYELRVSAKGRVRANSTFSIAKEKPTPMAAAPASPSMSTNEIFALMMQQQDAARRDSAAAADRQMTMMTTMMTAIIPALAGGRQQATSPGELAALVTALRPKGDGGGGLKETLEAMAAFKTLMGEPGGGEAGGNTLDMDDLVGSGARLVGPAMKALGDYIANQRRPAGSRFRIIELVKVDVTYMFSRGHDPEKAADMVYDVIEANHVTGAEIDELAAHFALSPTGLDDLAREGIDLRSNPQWAAEFFSALHAIHTSPQDDSDGGDGGAANA